MRFAICLAWFENERLLPQKESIHVLNLIHFTTPNTQVLNPSDVGFKTCEWTFIIPVLHLALLRTGLFNAEVLFGFVPGHPPFLTPPGT